MSLRISAPSRDGSRRRGPGGGEVEPDFYMSRLIKLLPAEAVAVYPLLQNRAHAVVEDVARDEIRRNPPPQQPAGTATGDIIPSSDAGLTDLVIAPDHWLLVAIAWFVLLLVVIMRWQATRDPQGNAQWGAVVIAAISFFLWVPTMHGSFGIMEFATAQQLIAWPKPIQEFIPELALIFWTIVVPVFYKPDH